MSSNVRISVNGDGMEIPHGTTVAALLKLLHVEPGQIAVELDGNIVRHERWCDISVPSGATVEVVRFVGGG